MSEGRVVLSEQPLPVDSNESIAQWRRRSAMALRWALMIVVGVLLWQVVRFWQGNVGMPAFGFVFDLLGISLPPQVVSSDPLGGIFYAFLLWALGTMHWLGLAHVVLFLGDMTARVLEVGWAESRRESREQRELAGKEEKAKEARWRRRRLRDAIRRRREGRSSGILALAVGAILGAWLF